MVKKLFILLLSLLLIISFSGIVLGEEIPASENSIIENEDDGAYIDKELPRSENVPEQAKGNRIKVAGM